MATSTETRSYRGGSLEELLPRILEEVGPEAVITRQRDGIVGGFGGFFGKKCVEVEVQAPAKPAVRPAVPRRAIFDAYDSVSTPSEDEAPEPRYEDEQPEPGSTGSPLLDAMLAQARPFAAHLAEAEDDEEIEWRFQAAPTVSEEATVEAPAVEVEPEPVAEVAPEPVAAVEPEPVVEPEPELLLPEPEPVESFAFLAQPIEAQPIEQLPPLEVAPEPVAQAAPVAPVIEAVEVAPAPAAEPVQAALPAPARLPRTLRTDSIAEAKNWAAAELEQIKAGRTPMPGETAFSRSFLPARRASIELVAVGHALAESGLPHPLIASIQKDVERDFSPFESGVPALAHARAALARRIKVRHGWRTRQRTIALVGIHGSGKTLTAAKLCHAFARGAGLSVSALSLEPPRRALQLGMLTEGLGVDFQVASSVDLVPMVADRVEGDLVVVDTPSVNPSDRDSVENLVAMLDALQPDEVHLLVPASPDIRPSEALLEVLAKHIGVDRILITGAEPGCDVAPAVGLAIGSKCPISYLSRGSETTVGIAPADPSALAGMVLR